MIANFLLREGNIKSLLSQKLKKPTIKEFKANLQSVISKTQKIDIEELYESSNQLLSKIVKNISKEEINFCENFNRNNPNFENLFEKIKINPQLKESPLLKIKEKENVEK